MEFLKRKKSFRTKSIEKSGSRWGIKTQVSFVQLPLFEDRETRLKVSFWRMGSGLGILMRWSKLQSCISRSYLCRMRLLEILAWLLVFFWDGTKKIGVNWTNISLFRKCDLQFLIWLPRRLRDLTDINRCTTKKFGILLGKIQGRLPWSASIIEFYLQS